MGLRQRWKDNKPGEETDLILGETDSIKIRSGGFSVVNSLIAPLCLFTVGFIVYLIISSLDSTLPEPVQPGTHNRFIAENAHQNLLLLSQIGPKVIGSFENEVLAVNIITNKIREIMKSVNPIHKMKYNLQKVSGSFHLNAKMKDFYQSYANLQNIVVKIGPHTPISNISLLVNCHFDSVPTSPGSSDDGLNCATMLEILRILSLEKDRLPVNVIFLFNGAEEAMLLASHGFITKHQWSDELKAFINLESCGAGGRETLFQTGPNHPWLVKKYAESAPHPSGLVLAEEIFQSGLVPSDTDFRIFRDFGKIPGLDLAHCGNGYVYHTKYDNIESINNVHGVLQHTGDNILALIKSIISSDEINHTNSIEVKTGNEIYFDLFGFILIGYSTPVSYKINIIVAILSLATIVITYLKILEGKTFIMICSEILLRLFISLAVIISLISYNISIGFFLGKMNASMAWYNHSIWAVLLYFIPTVVLKCAAYFKLNSYQKKTISPIIQTQCLCLSSQFFWTICLLVGTFFGIRSTYIILIQVLPCTVICGLMVPIVNKRSSSWLASYIFASALSSLYICYVSILAFKLFIPITGRMGAEKNPEIIIGLLATVLSLLITDYMLPLSVLLRDGFLSIAFLYLLHILSIILIITTPLGFPYSWNEISQKPQRVIAEHMERVFHSKMGDVEYKDSGFKIETLDYHGISLLPSILVESHMPQKYNPSPKSGNYLWIPANTPAFEDPVSLELSFEQPTKKNTKHFNFSVTGPDHMELKIHPMIGKLISWSFDEGIPKPQSPHELERYYLINRYYGLGSEKWTFWLELEVGENDWNDTYMKIQVIGRDFHSYNSYTTHFVKILSHFPNWSHVTSSITSEKTYFF